MDTGALDEALDTEALDTGALETGALDSGALDTGAVETVDLVDEASDDDDVPLLDGLFNEENLLVDKDTAQHHLCCSMVCLQAFSPHHAVASSFILTARRALKK